MPENDTNNNERLIEGQQTFDPTTDEAITAVLNQLRRREIPGLPDREIVVEGESYPPKSVVPFILPEPIDVTLREETKDTGVKPGLSDSALGKLIHQGRTRRLKRAA